ncbi:hypothetical protein [Rhodobium gokarnense]|uniref:Membrane protein n=1 Tax=Rhodobium gokarnense TaxID=364296 RepID=A0ABT3HEL4_9HYPH|nr:hypothetical protein [Rhodobium gokarnense]MCW2308810.1 putative membrane protein [Rhodobium gokarnense]
MIDVPPIDAQPEAEKAQPQRQTNIEFRLLEASAKAKENLNREADQRYYLRWLAVIVALAIIFMMSFALFHMSHNVIWGTILTVPATYAIALVVSPIISITAILIALFIAAFRGFKKDDEENFISAAKDGMRGSGIIS